MTDEYCSKTGKKIYESKSNARGQINHMQREDGRRRRKMESLKSYRCSLCGGWHVGNLFKEKRHG